jgi:hypothetical protein
VKQDRRGERSCCVRLTSNGDQVDGDADTVVGRPRRTVLLWVAVAVIGVASVLAIVVVRAVQRPDAPTPPGSATGLVTELAPLPEAPLNSAGDLADVVTDVELRPGQVLYLAWQRNVGGEVEELWVPHDRGTEWLFRSTIGDQEERAAGGEFRDSVLFPPLARTRADLARLPRDPAALYETVRAKVVEMRPGTASADSAPQLAISFLTGLLYPQVMAPAELRATAFRTLGYLPGITVEPGARTADGRAAVGLRWDTGIERYALLVDPATGRVIGDRGTPLPGDTGPTNGRVAIESIVDEVGATPAP